MEEWNSDILINLLDTLIDYRGKTPKKTSSGVPLVTAKIIKGGSILPFEEFIAENDYDSWMVRGLPQPGDVVLTTEAPLGEVAQLDNTKVALAQRVVTLRGKKGILDNTYLKYYLQSDIGQKRLTARETGTTVTGIKQSELRRVEISYPDFETQCRIASILKSLDDKIALNNRINHNLEEQAKALYKSWFVDFEPFKDGQFVDSELGMIPEGWRVGTLSELGDIVAGGTPSKTKPEYYTNNGIAWLTPKDLSVKCYKFTARGEIDITEDGYKNSSAKLMPRGSVLFSSRAPIGYISIAKGDICTNQGFKSVVPKYAGTAYLYYWLCENTEAIEAQASGSTFKEASGSLMRSFPALVPEKSVIDSFEKELSPILNEQEILEEEINYAEQIRDSLLPRLMSGELVMNC